MKRSAMVILTAVVSISISSCTLQNISQYPPDPVYGEVDSDTSRMDTSRSNTLGNYDYYYRSRFFDDLFRSFFPKRYYAIITSPGYVPTSKRPLRVNSMDVAHQSRSIPVSNRRGGFGHHGMTHTVIS